MSVSRSTEVTARLSSRVEHCGNASEYLERQPSAQTCYSKSGGSRHLRSALIEASDQEGERFGKLFDRNPSSLSLLDLIWGDPHTSSERSD